VDASVLRSALVLARSWRAIVGCGYANGPHDAAYQTRSCGADGTAGAHQPHALDARVQTPYTCT